MEDRSSLNLDDFSLAKGGPLFEVLVRTRRMRPIPIDLNTLISPAGPAIGAAGGAAGGFVGGTAKASQPSPVYMNFVNRCLGEKGYQVIGWE